MDAAGQEAGAQREQAHVVGVAGDAEPGPAHRPAVAAAGVLPQQGMLDPLAGAEDAGAAATFQQVEFGADHQATWWQTGQTRWRLRRSHRAWLVAVASWNPQVGQEATQRPASRCSAGCSPSSAGPWSSGWVMAWSGSQRWWVISAAAAQGSGQL